jgi:hypothetical protein
MNRLHRIPGFTAEAACHPTSGRFRQRLTRREPGMDGVVTPARDTVFVASGDDIYCCDLCGSNPDGTHMICDCTLCASSPGGISGTRVLHTLRS